MHHSCRRSFLFFSISFTRDHICDQIIQHKDRVIKKNNRCNDHCMNLQTDHLAKSIIHRIHYAAQKMKFSITDFFSKCDQIRSLHLLKKSVMEYFILCAVLLTRIVEINVILMDVHLLEFIHLLKRILQEILQKNYLK